MCIRDSLDAIHDTVHEMARDEARHGKAFEGLLKRYFSVHVLCDGIDEESGLYLCRTTGDAPEVDGNVCVSSEEPLYPGQFYDVLVDDSDLYDLYRCV